MSKLVNTVLALFFLFFISATVQGQNNANAFQVSRDAAQNILTSGGAMNAAVQSARNSGDLVCAYGVLSAIQSDFSVILGEVSGSGEADLQMLTEGLGASVSELEGELNTLNNLLSNQANPGSIRAQKNEIASVVLKLKGGGRSIRAEIQTIRGR